MDLEEFNTPKTLQKSLTWQYLSQNWDWGNYQKYMQNVDSFS